MGEAKDSSLTQGYKVKGKQSHSRFELDSLSLCLYGDNRFTSFMFNNKAVVKATLLGEVNFKIKTGERTPSIKILLIVGII